MPAARHRDPGFARFAQRYRSLAVIALNSALLLVLLNVGAALLLRVLPVPEPGALRYGMARLERVYPDWSQDKIRQVIRETWSRQYVYEPFSQFKEEEFHGEYLNIAPEGFRLVEDQGPWPPDAARWNLFLFGGSTAFGYGLADEDTIPSRLQQELRAAGCVKATVYNLARSNYYSSQERVQFQQLLAQGIRPAMAIFVDGLNEFFYYRDEPKFSRRLRYMMAETGLQTARRALSRLPISALMKRLWPADRDDARTPTEEEKPALVAEVLDRWLRNKQLVEGLAGAAGVEALFVWQPVPTYGYDLSRHLFFDPERRASGHFALSGAGYREMAARQATTPELAADAGFVWLGDLQAGRAEPLYVDGVHYSAEFSRLIASRIAARVGPLCSAAAPIHGADTPADRAAGLPRVANR